MTLNERRDGLKRANGKGFLPGEGSEQASHRDPSKNEEESNDPAAIVVMYENRLASHSGIVSTW